MPLVGLESFDPKHQAALSPFYERAGQLMGWSASLDGIFRVNKAKGIHEPQGFDNVLSSAM